MSLLVVNILEEPAILKLLSKMVVFKASLLAMCLTTIMIYLLLVEALVGLPAQRLVFLTMFFLQSTFVSSNILKLELLGESHPFHTLDRLIKIFFSSFYFTFICESNSTCYSLFSLLVLWGFLKKKRLIDF